MASRGYVLECLHTFVTEIAPRHNDKVWCSRCEDYKTVGVPPDDRYIVTCANCKRMAYRDYGRAFVTAETRAASHSLKYAGHRVKLLNRDALVREFYHPAMRVELDAPPF